MVFNLSSSGLCNKFYIYDKDADTAINVANVVSSASATSSIEVATIESIRKKCDVIFSMLPNDIIIKAISTELLESGGGNKFIHISCSTISPTTSRALAVIFFPSIFSILYFLFFQELHEAKGHDFIASPVFARPDGIARKQATWLVAGKQPAKEKASILLASGGNVVDLGDDVGAANVVKLCGNFLIAVLNFMFSI